MKLSPFTLAMAGLVLASPLPVSASEGEGSALVGWIEDLNGQPVTGALVSLFGKQLKGGPLRAFSDASGRFIVSPLPAGSYVLRAIERFHLPSAPQRVTILPNQNTLFSLALAPLLEPLSEAELAERVRELDWRMRHKSRSVLEEEGARTASAADVLDRPAIAPLAGAVEVMSSPGTFGALDNPGLAGTPVNWSVLRLRGRMGGGGEWAVSGLVSDADGTSWRMAGQFNVRRFEGHELRVGSGYGTWVPRPLFPGDHALDSSSIGAGGAFLEDTWRISDRLTTRLATRYSYIGFVSDRNHVDPQAMVDFASASGVHFHASFSTITLAPGGDLLAISSQAPSAALSLAVTDPALRPEKVYRLTLGAQRAIGETCVGVRFLSESTADQLLNSFDRSNSPNALRITNGRDLSTHGVSVSVGHQIGKVMGASLTYTYGQARRSETSSDLGSFTSFKDAEFQDIGGHLEASVFGSETRVLAFYRVNLTRAHGDPLTPASFLNSRFDVQVRQGLPFLGALTRADWELLVAVRNLFYEEEEAGLLDEFAVVNPPKRLLGGIAVRF